MHLRLSTRTCSEISCRPKTISIHLQVNSAPTISNIGSRSKKTEKHIPMESANWANQWIHSTRYLYHFHNRAEFHFFHQNHSPCSRMSHLRTDCSEDISDAPVLTAGFPRLTVKKQSALLWTIGINSLSIDIDQKSPQNTTSSFFRVATIVVQVVFRSFSKKMANSTRK